MITKIIGLIFGIMIFAAGIIFSVKEKDGDKTSKKIYLITTVAGFLVAAGCAVSLFIG